MPVLFGHEQMAGDEGVRLPRRFAPPPPPAARASSAIHGSARVGFDSTNLAGDEGVEPPLSVLETDVQPLTLIPRRRVPDFRPR